MTEASWDDLRCLPDFFNKKLADYYDHIFPYKQYYRWLCYGRSPLDYFARRELAFILEDDVHLRYRSFTNELELKDAIKQAKPHKIDIGPVYNHRPSLRKELDVPLEAKEREIVLDIDLTDYDDVRVCCQGGSMCNQCWKFAQAAIKVIERALEEDFAFKHRMWIYSGRRGIHCWVADSAARQLNNAQRTGVIEYLSVLGGGEKQARKVNLPSHAFYDNTRKGQQILPLHPSIARAYNVLIGADGGRNYFMEIATDQGWFEGDCEKIIKLLPPINDARKRQIVMEHVRECLHETSSVEDKWKRLTYLFGENNLHDLLKSHAPPEANRVMAEYIRSNLHFPVEVVLQMTYPRLDVNVTKGVNHLLKSPFSCHPKTGRIAVPLNIEIIDAFTPDVVPRIDRLVQEAGVNRQNRKEEGENKENRLQLDYKRTSLDDYVNTFTHFVDGILADETRNESSTKAVHERIDN